ncbi:unnamed protein product [Rotaria magnacalcarata]|uniref:Uncharacterized protein n=1 Tax=Rotaria magnacalcarata TaxID=392030 RepID=A0A819WFJ1_9BILA|nr:unnamed protein product [Rotaria magnacalcarata]CAF1622324.1 unnamed protein product [Rotaria magnacalcarata]CAF1944723.1 unnamed protein product [Rotaria magnacalcarata]CAF2113076.1 unnamed protein product [Rotaria magnacalcarata]CAF2245516.1 unnamed protein product [Rotaria magnacalcarata]
MDRKEVYSFKPKLQEVVPSTRFGQAMASLFFLKRHKKREDHGRGPVVSSLRAQSTLHIKSSPSCNTMPFEVLTPRKISTTPPPIQVSSFE